MKIVWHSIPEYPGYEINRLGQIKRKSTGRVLKPFDDSRGYLRVSLNGKNIKVHVLVARMFVPNPHGYPVIDHKRGNKHDNGVHYKKTRKELTGSGSAAVLKRKERTNEDPVNRY